MGALIATRGLTVLLRQDLIVMTQVVQIVRVVNTGQTVPLEALTEVQDRIVPLRRVRVVMMQEPTVRAASTIQTGPVETLIGMQDLTVPLCQDLAVMMQAEIVHLAASTLRIARLGPITRIVRVETSIRIENRIVPRLPALAGTTQVQIVRAVNTIQIVPAKILIGMQDRIVPSYRGLDGMMQAETVRRAASIIRPVPVSKIEAVPKGTHRLRVRK